MGNGTAVLPANRSAHQTTASDLSAQSLAENHFSNLNFPSTAILNKDSGPFPGREQVTGVACDPPGTRRRDNAIQVLETDRGYKLQVSIVDPFQEVVAESGAKVKLRRSDYTIDGFGNRPTITVEFNLSKNFEVQDSPKFKLTFMSSNSGCIALDYSAANGILENPESRLYSQFELIERVVLGFAQKYNSDPKDAEVFGLQDKNGRNFRSDSNWGGRMGRVVTLCSEAASLAVGELFRARNAPAIYTVVVPKSEQVQSDTDTLGRGIPVDRRFSHKSNDGLLERPLARITSPMLKDVDYYNIRVLKALIQNEKIPGLSNLLPDVVAAENKSAEQKRTEAQATRIDTYSTSNHWAAAGRLRQKKDSVRDLAVILSASFRGEELERKELRRMVYERLIREPRIAQSVLDSLIDGGVVTRDSRSSNYQFAKPVVTLKRCGSTDRGRVQAESDELAKGRVVSEEGKSKALLQAFIGLFEGINRPEAAAAYLETIKRGMGLGPKDQSQTQVASPSKLQLVA